MAILTDATRKTRWAIVLGALCGAVLLANLIALTSDRDGAEPVLLKYISGRCIGGCSIDGPPLSMDADDLSAKHAHPAVEQRAPMQSLEEFPFDQVLAVTLLRMSAQD